MVWPVLVRDSRAPSIRTSCCEAWRDSGDSWNAFGASATTFCARFWMSGVVRDGMTEGKRRDQHEERFELELDAQSHSSKSQTPSKGTDAPSLKP